MVVDTMSDNIYIYPTDTVWGIGGSIESRDVYKEIAQVKGTKSNKPISILFSSIEEMTQYISFKPIFSKEWLEKYFSLESTLGIPKSWWKDDKTLWSFGDSEFVAIRCLKRKHIADICTRESSPIFTTSLNLTGDAPITDNKEAKEFYSKNVLKINSKAIFIEDDENLSGDSSTMVFYDDTSFRIIRSGKLIKQVREHLELLPAKIL
jgi:L-threonylcarbamoyladenylate synthase